ncbi:NUDIX hydrolase [Paenibacillus sp. GXUN7292]|uniref:NUDIX hydrolase n=1 Tax=Paenibacillus sp. GXUN7292 TaxID=3422499 RepID=UPI003D7D4E45
MAFPTHIVSAGGIVEDGKGNILLVKAHDDGWVYPGGITEVGENLIDGVIREIKEESGIDATVSHLINIVSSTVVHKWYDGVTDVPTKVMFDFVCKAEGGELTTSEETSDCRWVPKDKVLDCSLPEYISPNFFRTPFVSATGKRRNQISPPDSGINDGFPRCPFVIPANDIETETAFP